MWAGHPCSKSLSFTISFRKNNDSAIVAVRLYAHYHAHPRVYLNVYLNVHFDLLTNVYHP